jgi:hypothetical protein
MLETRVLLSRGRVKEPLSLLAAYPARTAALMRYAALHPSTSAANTNPVRDTATVSKVAPLLVAVQPPSSSAAYASSSNQGALHVTPGQRLAVSTAQPSSLGGLGRAVAPLIVTLGGNRSSVGNHAGMPTGSSASSPTTTVPTNLTAADSPFVPVQSYAVLRGTLSAERPSITVQVPLGLATSSVGLAVRAASPTNRGEVPVVQRLVLVDVQGQTVDQYTPDSAQGQPEPQNVNVVLPNAPSGGRLLVQIGAADGPQAIAPSPMTVSSADPNGNITFVLGVQRREQDSAGQPGAALGQGQAILGTVWLGLSSLSGASPGFEPSPATIAGTGAVAVNGEEVVARSPDASLRGMPLEPVDGFNVRLPTGPFASRTAGPQGPIASTSESDLTPAVDRHERGLLQEIEGVDDGDAPEVIGRRSQLASAAQALPLGNARSSIEADGHDGAVVALRRAGGFPLKVTGSLSGQRGDLAALLAALPAATDLQDQAQSLERVDDSIDKGPLVLALAMPRSTERSESPDYAKAAWGLALGVGLATGPLFPDLVMAVQARMPKWMLGLRVTERPCDSAVRRRRGLGKIWDWLQRFGGSR